jgi:AraC-like DNA-binding protein
VGGDDLRQSPFDGTCGRVRRRLAARTPQFSFKKSFNCSTHEWIQRRRLQLARERVLSSTELTTVANVAVSCDFNRLGAFAAASARRCGASPSETLRQRRQGLCEKRIKPADSSLPVPDSSLFRCSALYRSSGGL